MTEAEIIEAVLESRRTGIPIEVAGAGSLLSKLPEPSSCTRLDLAAFTGVSAYDPADLMVKVKPGTRIEDLALALAAEDQECPIEGPGSTVGGRIASGLSGPRRLKTGPLRDWLLGARMVTARGTAIRVGAQTVKNVTGYDLPRLCCGSWGTLGILTELTLRVRSRPAFRSWYVTQASHQELTRRLSQPASIIQMQDRLYVLLEGHPDDCLEQAQRCNLAEADAPRLPEGVRLSVPPARVSEVCALLEGVWGAEMGVGIIHTEVPDLDVVRLRRHCEAMGGRLLVLKRAPGVPAFGAGATSEFDTRVKRAFDPDGVFAPWRFAA